MKRNVIVKSAEVYVRGQKFFISEWYDQDFLEETYDVYWCYANSDNPEQYEFMGCCVSFDEAVAFAEYLGNNDF